MDIIVTTPKTQMANAAKEAANCIADGGGRYFRRFNARPCNIQPGEKVWYVEDGYLRGYAIVDTVEEVTKKQTCSTTGKDWSTGYFVYMQADSWKWIEPIKFPGFMGHRRFDIYNLQYKVIGDWTTEKPTV